MELFLFILLFRVLSAVQSQSVPAVLAHLSHVDSPADAVSQFGQGPVGQSDCDQIEGSTDHKRQGADAGIGMFW